jgi:hypothetical protein
MNGGRGKTLYYATQAAINQTSSGSADVWIYAEQWKPRSVGIGDRPAGLGHRRHDIAKNTKTAG